MTKYIRFLNIVIIVMVLFMIVNIAYSNVLSDKATLSGYIRDAASGEELIGASDVAEAELIIK